MAKIPQQKWNHFRKGSKFLNKDGTISEKGQKVAGVLGIKKSVQIFRNPVKLLPCHVICYPSCRKVTIFSADWTTFLLPLTYYYRLKDKQYNCISYYYPMVYLDSSMVPFQKSAKYQRQKWYPFQKRSKILNKNGTISDSEKGQQKWYHFRKGSKILKASTKMVPFQKRVKNPKQKWYHFRKVQNISGKNGSKILNKNGTISEKGQKS